MSLRNPICPLSAVCPHPESFAGTLMMSPSPRFCCHDHLCSSTYFNQGTTQPQQNYVAFPCNFPMRPSCAHILSCGFLYDGARRLSRSDRDPPRATAWRPLRRFRPSLRPAGLEAEAISDRFFRRSLRGGGKTRRRAKTGKYCNLQHFRGPGGLNVAKTGVFDDQVPHAADPPPGGGLSLKPTRVGAPRRSGTLPDNFVFALGALLGPLGAQFYASWTPSCLGSHFDTHLGPILDPPGTLKSLKNHWFFNDFTVFTLPDPRALLGLFCVAVKRRYKAVRSASPPGSALSGRRQRPFDSAPRNRLFPQEREI